MDSKNLLFLLENPFNIGLETSKELNFLWEQYPFSQPLAYIRARFLLEQNHPDFERASSFAQAVAINRKVYNDYISGKNNPLRPKPLSLKIDLGDNEEDGVIASEFSNDIGCAKAGLHPNQGHAWRNTKKKHDHLIEKFIKEEPRISTPGKDLKKENLEEKTSGHLEGLVTETLAQIYVQQGFLADAIDIFEKLSEKNPEKSSYFAKKIETLKNQLKT